MNWDELKFWSSPEWDEIQEKLDACDQRGDILCPRRELMFSALDLVALEDVKVAIIGQDPYPDVRLATGVAFSIPVSEVSFPYSLGVILREYQNDLHLPIPSNGNLNSWSTRENVLLWNSIPSTLKGGPLSHYSWREYDTLTKEIVDELYNRSVVFLFVGAIAKGFSEGKKSSQVICTSHPAALRYGKRPNSFSGSRPFTTINDRLVKLGYDSVNWRLDNGKSEEKVQQRFEAKFPQPT